MTTDRITEADVAAYNKRRRYLRDDVEKQIIATLAGDIAAMFLGPPLTSYIGEPEGDESPAGHLLSSGRVSPRCRRARIAGPNGAMVTRPTPEGSLPRWRPVR